MKAHIFLKIAIALLIALVIIEVTIYSPVKLGGEPSLEIVFVNEEGNTVTIEYQLSSGAYPLDIQVVFLTSSRPAEPKPVYIYYDPDYPFIWTTAAAVYGLIGHLSAELEIRHYGAQVRVLDAQELRDFLDDTGTAENRILIAATGALPDTVLTKDRNLVKPWVQQGGTFFWISDYFLFYSAHEGEKLDWTDPRQPGFEEAAEFFGIENAILLNEANLEATNETSCSRALDITYSYVLRPLSLSVVEQLGGRILGLQDITSPAGHSASIASVPVGEGTAVVFGGELLFWNATETVVARDIAQILCSGVLEQELIDYKTYHLEGNQTVTDSYQINMIGRQPKVTIYAFQLGSQATFFDKKPLTYK